MYIGDYLARRALYSPHAVALVDAGRTPEVRLTYAEFNARANQTAHGLRQAGVMPGDRVAILARDGVEHLECFFACGKLGAVHVPLNWRMHWRELLAVLADVTPRVLLFGDDFAEAARELHAAGAAPSHYWHLDGAGWPFSVAYPALREAAPTSPVTYEALTPEDIAALIFTGGTTGQPKGAMISHRMIAWNVLNTVTHDITHGDVYLNVFPLFHTGGLFVYTLAQVVFGGTTLLLRQFEPARVLELLERERVTVFAAVPTMYQMLTQAPNWPTANLSALRFCTSGGAPLPVALVEQYTREKGIRFKQGFGMTEYGPGLFALAPEDAIRKAGSIGRPNFFIEAGVMDEAGHLLGPDQPGELVLKGPSGFSGYFNHPEASQAARDAAGWFHTGDVVRYDAEGYFFVLDRKKDMFISGGENIYPTEIEQALYRHPAVHMAAVVGVPSTKWGEVGVACVVLKPGQTATEVDLLDHLRAHLAKYKVPKHVVFMPALPISAAGKILKRDLRTQLTSEHNL